MLRPLRRVGLLPALGGEEEGGSTPPPLLLLPLKFDALVEELEEEEEEVLRLQTTLKETHHCIRSAEGARGGGTDNSTMEALCELVSELEVG